MNRNILIVDDNFRAYKSLSVNFKPLGYKTFYAANGSEALHSLKQNRFSIILLDLMLGEVDSRGLLDEILKTDDAPPVIMITGFASIESAVDSIKRGALNYIQKPVGFDELLNIIEKAISRKSPASLPESESDIGDFSESLSPQMVSVLGQAKRLAATDLPILILGENGTGKELMAEYIHSHSARNQLEFHKINCAAFQESILDNELFGHNKGAYTGADDDYKGIFELAHGHSLFLDEIGDMSLAIQAKILRTLQNREIRRIGGTGIIHVDVRFIAATNKNLEDMIEEKTFRQDLYYRLSTAVLHIPPLRERTADIPHLAKQFLKEDDRDLKFSDEVMNLFLKYPWHGNIRELKNAVQYARALVQDDTIMLKDLPGNMQNHRSAGDGFMTSNIRELAEKDIIEKTLKKYGFNKSRTAGELNMSRKTLYSKIEKYGIPLE